MMTKLFCGQHEHISTVSLAITVAVVLFCHAQVVGARDWYCGNAADTLKEFCQSCYASKRAHNALSLPSIKAKKDGMFLTKEGASGYLEAKRTRLFSSLHLNRRQHEPTNFISECCYNPCSPFEMIKYCCPTRQIELQNRSPNSSEDK